MKLKVRITIKIQFSIHLRILLTKKDKNHKSITYNYQKKLNRNYLLMYLRQQDLSIVRTCVHLLDCCLWQCRVL